MTKQEILTQFETDCKLQGGSTEAIHKALARATIEIECERNDLIRALGQTIDDRMTRIGDILVTLKGPTAGTGPQS